MSAEAAPSLRLQFRTRLTSHHVKVEPAVGFEPTTDGLQNRSSTPELSWRNPNTQPALDALSPKAIPPINRTPDSKRNAPLASQIHHHSHLRRSLL